MSQPAEGLTSSLLNGLSTDEVQQFYSLAKLRAFEDNDVIIGMVQIRVTPGNTLKYRHLS